MDPKGYAILQSFMFDERQATKTAEIEFLWQSVCQVYKQAKSCHDRRKDENAWAQLVRDALRLSIEAAGSKLVEINSV